MWPLASLMIVYMFALGLFIGSFLNVVIYRLPREGMSVVRPRSHCPNCLSWIAWYDNIPLLSYALLMQKCRHCRDYIPLRYPGVELLTGCLFGVIAWLSVRGAHPATWHELPWLYLAVACAFTANLIAISFIDIDLRIIPNELTYGGILLSPLASLLAPQLHANFPLQQPMSWLPLSMPLQKALFGSCCGIVIGAALILAIAEIGRLIFRKDAMGMGDVKLMALIGGITGWDGVLVTMALASVIGSVVGIARKLRTRDSYLPFGPFLAVAALLALLFKPQIWHWMTVRYPLWIAHLLGKQ